MISGEILYLGKKMIVIKQIVQHVEKNVGRSKQLLGSASSTVPFVAVTSPKNASL